MSKSSNKVIGITLGDPAGIGPEVVAKALTRINSSSNVSFLIIGDDHSKRNYFSKLRANWRYWESGVAKTGSIFPGRPSKESAKMSYEALKASVKLVKDKRITAVVTAPVSKEGILAIVPQFIGHTEFYASNFKVKKFDMMFVANQLKTLIITRHIPLSYVSRELTIEKVFNSILLADESLRKYFRIIQPSIAVCGVNPHAGEGGNIGREEITKIIPAIKQAQRRGVNVKGPFSADTLFTSQQRKGFDVIIAMFHDQGLIAIKTLFFDEVVNLTVGLPFVRTSPAHGTAFDIAGQDKADASSMYHAIKLAMALS